MHWRLYQASSSEKPLYEGHFKENHSNCVQLGQRAYLHCLRITVPADLPENCWIGYDIGIEAGAEVQWLAQTAPSLCYDQRPRPEFVFKTRVDQVLHGSCRKPHHDGIDGMLSVDEVLAQARHTGPASQPAMLLCTGDQVYTDDVAGPLLSTITQVIRLLGLFDEQLPSVDTAAAESGSVIDSQSLLADPQYYKRSSLLPSASSNGGARTVLFSGARKPIFTSINAENHLLTLAEVIAQYLLCWSPVLWELTDFDQSPAGVDEKNLELYQRQSGILHRFQRGLPRVRRALAHLPTYMIFDDHDITDDWNISRAWEQSAYDNPMARRVIGNALIGYFLCQGWGNAPEEFEPALVESVRDLFLKSDNARHDEVISRLLKLESWNYVIDTSPRVVVLDTRTQRWFSEVSPGWPSGLMDWESLAAAQQSLVGQPAVILVSPAPVFGVKLIEVIQRILTWFKLALMVDAENWMAHPGSASAILNIFRHRHTPQNFVILSGDVHYAFAFDVLLRRVDNGPEIWQITSSGMLNSFPSRLLRSFDHLNRWLFASRSPLNWLTRRRRMRIRQRRPSEYSERYRHQRLVNGCGVGRVVFDKEGKPVKVEQILATGETVEFVTGYDSDWVH